MKIERQKVLSLTIMPYADQIEKLNEINSEEKDVEIKVIDIPQLNFHNDLSR